MFDLVRNTALGPGHQEIDIKRLASPVAAACAAAALSLAIVVGEEVRNLLQVNVGDRLCVADAEAPVYDVRKGGKAAGNEARSRPRFRALHRGTRLSRIGGNRTVL